MQSPADRGSRGSFRTSGMAIIVPRTPAPGKPWVFRADAIDRNATVDQALLAKGYPIVTPPLTAQSGMVQQQWDETYRILVDNGFSKRPAMEATGAKGGEIYAWAIANPDRVTVQIPMVVDFRGGGGWARAGAGDGNEPQSVNSREAAAAEACRSASR